MKTILLTILTLGIALSTFKPVYAPRAYPELRQGTPKRLVYEICRTESHFRWWVIGDNGESKGPCQIKLATARDAGFTGHESELPVPWVAARVANMILTKCKRGFATWGKAVECYRRGLRGARRAKSLHPKVEEILQRWREGL